MGAIICNFKYGDLEDFTKKMSKARKEVRKRILRISGRNAFQEERRTNAKILSQE